MKSDILKSMRTVIIEDNKLRLERLSLILGEERDFSVVGTFASAKEALSGLFALAPDVVIVAYQLSDIPCIELIERIVSKEPLNDVVAYAGSDESERALDAIRAGATGCILHDATAAELIEALRTLQRGGVPLSPRVGREIIRVLQNSGDGEFSLLSAREKEIMKSLGEGLTYQAISARHSISRHTVHAHIKNIYRKLKVKDRKKAVSKAIRKGLL